MRCDSIYHKSIYNYCYQYDNNSIIINLITGYDIDKVIVHIGDPFTFVKIKGESVWVCKSYEYDTFMNLKYNKFWTIKVNPKFKRSRYFFELYSGREKKFLLEDSILSSYEIESYEGGVQKFSFPYLNNIDLNRVPRWVNNIIWYQIFIDRFCNKPFSNELEVVEEWNNYGEKVSDDYLFGGNLEGIISKLDYLSELGVNGIYLTPISVSDSSHKYDIINYFQIDNSLGNKDLVKKLVSEAHRRNIKVMFEGVFNHVSSKFFAWEDVVKKGVESDYINWFMVNEWPFDSEYNSIKGKYDTFGFIDSMPKFNTNEQEVINYILTICEFWIKEFDIDAIRLDVSDEISHECIKQIRKKVKEIKEDFFILGENWNNAIKWLSGDELDSVTNYPLRKKIIDFWTDTTINRDELYFSINECYMGYMKQTNEVIFNILDSHDTPRILTVLKDIDKLYQVLTMLLTITGTPCLYYGTEVLLEGSNATEGRRCMPWESINTGCFEESTAIVKKLIELRKRYISLSRGDMCFYNNIDNNRVISYRKILKEINEEFEIILNCSNQSINIDVDSTKVMFSRLYDNGLLEKDGILIIKK